MHEAHPTSFSAETTVDWGSGGRAPRRSCPRAPVGSRRRGAAPRRSACPCSMPSTGPSWWRREGMTGMPSSLAAARQSVKAGVLVDVVLAREHRNHHTDQTERMAAPQLGHGPIDILVVEHADAPEPIGVGRAELFGQPGVVGAATTPTESRRRRRGTSAWRWWERGSRRRRRRGPGRRAGPRGRSRRGTRRSPTGPDDAPHHRPGRSRRAGQRGDSSAWSQTSRSVSASCRNRGARSR